MNPTKRIFRALREILVLTAALHFWGCAARYDFDGAAKLAAVGRHLDAAARYERFADSRSGHELTPEALLRAAEIYNYKLRLPAKAASLYRRLQKDYSSDAAIVARAAKGLLISPDYFPLFTGAEWVEGDSATGGSNMKAVWTAQEISTGVFRVEKKFFAGAKAVTTRRNYFTFKDYALIEKPSAPAAPGVSASSDEVFLEYPIYHGKKWRRRDGSRVVEITAEFVSEPVVTRAGTFTECLRIAERYSDSPGVTRYNYYSPYVGWALTTISVARGEHRNSELISFKLRD
ncbi:MAG: hypothetical protein QME32_07190 [Endomicrobiia bacterium]|nr:hypothetical protein [Endomicrobiia bacterium]